jgi:uncharacterized protein
MNNDFDQITKNPFVHFRVRRLFWDSFLLSGAMSWILGLSADGGNFNARDPVFVPLIYCLTFIFISLFAGLRLHKLQLKFPQLLGRTGHHCWQLIIGIAISILLFLIGSGQLFFYILSFFDAAFVESILRQKLFLSGSETLYPELYNFLTIVAVLIVAPITEEFIFRGIILHRWAVKWGVTPALLMSSLLFGALHSNLVGLFVFGLIMALLYLKTRTLFVPIACHALNNFLAIGLEVVSPTPVSVLSQLHAYWWVGVVYLVLSAPWLMMFIYKQWPRHSRYLPYLMNSLE